MTSHRVRLALWFSMTYIAVTAVFVTFSFLHLRTSIRLRARPNAAEQTMTADGVMRDVARSFIIHGIPVLLVSLGWGWWLARRIAKPLDLVTEKLQEINSSTLNRRVELRSKDEMFIRLEKGVNGLVTRLEGSFGEVSEYAARVSHELRTPITILRLKIEQSRGKIEPELSDELQSELQRLSHVVDQALLIARAEQGRLPLKPEPVNLGVLVRHIADDFQLLAEGHHRKLECRSRGERWIRVDPKYCQQLIQTLLTNALVHGRGTIYLHLNPVGHRIHLTVGNQVRYSTKAKEMSLGLGLRVVRALLSVHPGCLFRQRHGTLWHASRISFPEIEAPVNVAKPAGRHFAEDS